MQAMKTIVFISGFGISADMIDHSFTHRFSFLPGVYSRLEKIVENSSDPVTLIAWSLGGKWALQLKKQYPEIVQSVILLSQRPQWTDVIDFQRQQLQENGPQGYLMQFYENLFRGNESDYELFYDRHLKNHLEIYDEQRLQWLLSELETYILQPEELNHGVQLIHARYDAIAPPALIKKYARQHELNLTVLKTVRSHYPFSEALWTLID